MKSRLVLVFFVIALMAVPGGCGGKCDLAISVEGEGEVTPAPGIHEYSRGTPVVLTATPAIGWGFAGWSGPNGNIVIDNAITMDGNKYITAVFAKLQHPLDLSIEPEGAGTVEVVIVPTSRGIEHGQTVRLTATPGDGYVFGHWNDDSNDTDNTHTFTMDAPKSIKATFVARVADPVFSLTEGTGGLLQSVRITCATPGATIRYTTDGVTVPTSTAGTVYSGEPIQVSESESAVIKAIACKEDLADSAVVTYVYTTKAPAPIVSLPTGGYEGTQRVTLTGADMTIRYTLDGSAPSPQNGALYTGPITISDTTTLKAVAYSANLSPSDAVTRNYTIDHWPVRASMPTARQGLGAVAVGGKIYAIGGFDGTSYLNTVEMYDPNTNTWSTRAPMPTARGYLSAVAVNGLIYVLGGRTDSAYVTDAVECYDPAANTWTSKTKMPMPSGLFTAVAVNGIIHAVGGGYDIVGGDSYFSGQQEYNPDTDTWAMGTSAGDFLRGYGAVAVGSKIHFIGGTVGFMSSNRTWIYDTTTKTWSEGANLPYHQEYLAAAYLDGRIYAFGGVSYFYDSGPILDNVNAFDPGVGTWTSAFSLPAPRYHHAAVTLNNGVFIIGGASASGVLADVVEFRP